MIRRLLERLGLIRRRHVTVLDHMGNLTPIKGVSLHTQQLGRARRPPASVLRDAREERERQERFHAQARARKVFEHDPSAVGAIHAVIAYGMNWTELFAAHEAVRELTEAADRVVNAHPSEYLEAVEQLRAAVECCRKLRT